MLTGREARTLPAETVQGLFWRIAVDRLWDPDLMARASVPLAKGASAKQAGDWMTLDKAAKGIREVVFPEDDDG